MRYRLPAHLAFGVTPDGAVFLDIRRDRYFRLSVELDKAFRALADNACCGLAGSPAIARLIEHGVLVQAPDGQGSIAGAAPPTPSISLREAPPANVRGAPWEAALVARAVFASRRRLRSSAFESIIAGLAARKRVYGGATADQVLLRQRAARFLRHRPLVPIAPVCLTDSLAMLDFLAKARFCPDLVFGVCLDPFSAHCWVQAGAWVLNDTVDRARAHTPVLVV